MKTSTLIPVVAYLGLAGYTAAAPVNVESTHALDKRTFCFFGIGWGCNTAPAPVATPKPATSSAAPSTKAAVSSSSAVKASAVASSSAKVVSSAVASSSAKAVVSTSAAATKVSTANWAACTDFDWNSWGSDWTWGGGFDKNYVKSWYVAEYGYAPPQGMNWRQVSSLVSKFGQKTKPASPKTTSKFTGKGCANPWTSAANTKTTVATSKPVSTTAAASKPVATSAAASSAVVSKASSSAAAASSAVVSKPASSAAASSASASVAKPVTSSSSAVVVAPASSAAASSAVVVAPASSAAASSAVVVAPASSAVVVAPVSSAAASSAAASSAAASPAASSAAASSAAAPSSDAAPASSSAAAVASPSPSPDATSASSAAASPSAGTGSGSSDGSNGTPGTGSGSSDGSSGVPGTGAGVPGTGAGSNNATGTATSEAPAATTSAAVVINGFTSGGCVQEVSGRLLDKVQTSSPAMTIEMCTATCDSYGYAVAGLEYGSECYCGTLEDIEDTLVSGECKMTCSGSDQICGGPNAINIYVDASNVPATVQLPAGWTTYGTVTEGDNGRLLPVQLYNDASNTVETCANRCASAGYLIAGTEYSSECYCGNAFVSAAGGGQLVDDSAAFMACAGNGAQKCGGPSILSVTSAFGNAIPSA